MNAREFVWCQGKIKPVGELAIPATDRVFEHGLGLFETMRGTACRVPMWALHRQRLRASAGTLGLNLDERCLPGPEDFTALVQANGLEASPSRLRLVLTGGTAEQPGQVFVTARPLRDIKPQGLTLAADFWPVDARDPLIRHKSLNYWLRRMAHEQAIASGADDALSIDPAGTIWESALAALFMVVDGRWVAPPAGGPMLASVAAGEVERLLSEPGQPGLMRQPVTIDLLTRADEVILANALRGPMAVAAWRHRRFETAGPGFTALRELWRRHWF